MDTILFDLDGTILPLDMEKFMSIYFGEICKSFGHLYEPKILTENIMKSTKVMLENDGTITNEEAFVASFKEFVGDKFEECWEIFNNFYDNDFQKTREATSENECIRNSVKLLKEKGYTLVLATNPLFPYKAVEHRIKWNGLEASDFVHITTFENNRYCKPQIEYYKEILNDIGKKPEDCMMVGNDEVEDMVAGKLGIKTFLIEDCIIKRENAVDEPDYRGDYKTFYEFVVGLDIVK